MLIISSLAAWKERIVRILHPSSQLDKIIWNILLYKITFFFCYCITLTALHIHLVQYPSCEIKFISIFHKISCIDNTAFFYITFVTSIACTCVRLLLWWKHCLSWMLKYWSIKISNFKMKLAFGEPVITSPYHV